MIEAQIVETGPLPVGALLQGRYRILGLLGNGGMSRVYRAEDRDSGGMVAIKEMLPQGDGSLAENARRRFQQEADTLADLSHPAIPDVLAFFSQAGRFYLVMEFVEGETLQDIMRRTGKPFPEGAVGDWVCQVCDVLSYLHGQQPPLVFRDLKPSNIMLDSEGRIRLIDFGIARFFKPGRGSDTESMGTAGYSSPEQYGAGQTDARSDVYSLGACIHFLLTGRNPVEAPFSFPPVRTLNPAVSSGMERIIARCLSMSPDQRYQSAADLREAIVAQAQLTGAIANRPAAAAGSQQQPRPSQSPSSESSRPRRGASPAPIESFPETTAPAAAGPAAPTGVCLKHTDATQITIGGRKVCRACAEDRRRVHRRWLLCQWGMVVLFPLCVLAFCLAGAGWGTLASSPSSGDPASPRPHIYWWFVSVASAFFASWIAALVVHAAAIRRDHRAEGSRTVVRPFDFRHRLRDLNVLGLLFAAVFSALTLITPGASSAGAWFHWRAPAILLGGIGSLLILLYSPLSRAFTRRSFIPEGRRLEAMALAAVYALSLLAAVPVTSRVLISLLRGPVPESWLLAISLVSGAGAAGLVGSALKAKRDAGPVPGWTSQGSHLPLAASIALIGPSNVGKTVFLTRAFHLLEHKPHGAGFRIRPAPETPRQLTVLRRLIRRLHEERAWPDPTVEILHVPLTLTLCGDEIMKLRWMDVPGGAITHGEQGDDENIYGAAASEYEQRLIDSHAVLLLVDAEELASRASCDQIHQIKSYFDQMDRLVDRLKIGRGRGGVPLAIVVTKCCRVTASRREMQKLIRPLINHWRAPAQRSGVPPPPVKVFWSSAVVIPSGEPNLIPPFPAPLVAEQCIEPFWWTVEQILRQNIGLSDRVEGFYCAGALQDLACQMAALAEPGR